MVEGAPGETVPADCKVCRIIGERNVRFSLCQGRHGPVCDGQYSGHRQASPESLPPRNLCRHKHPPSGTSSYFRSYIPRRLLRKVSFVADKPRIWPEKRLANTLNNGSNYNLAPDG